MASRLPGRESQPVCGQPLSSVLQALVRHVAGEFVCQHWALLHTPRDLTQTQLWHSSQLQPSAPAPPQYCLQPQQIRSLLQSSTNRALSMDHQEFPVFLLDPVPFALKMQDKSTKALCVAAHLNSRINLISHNLLQVLLWNNGVKIPAS